MTNGTRERWLTRCALKMAPWLGDVGLALGEAIRLTCGWPSRGALSRAKRRVGECWPSEVSADGVVEIFISPYLDDPVEVAATVLHESIHAAGLMGHGGKFARAAASLGLEGKPSETVASEAFRQRIAPVLLKLGDYPHAKLDTGKSNRHKAQSGRLIKVECPACAKKDDRYVVRMSKAMLELGAPACGVCGATMEAA